MATRRSGRRVQRQAGPPHRGFRSCVGCRGRSEPAELLRLVCDPEGRVLIDRKGKAPGRGAYLCYSSECIERALRTKSLERALRRGIKPLKSEELVTSVVSMLDERIIAHLSIGKTAGWIRSGMDVLERCRRQVKMFVLAEDVAADSDRRIRGWGRSTGATVVDYKDRFVLGATQGQPERVALGVVDSPLASRLSNEFHRRARVLVAGQRGNR